MAPAADGGVRAGKQTPAEAVAAAVVLDEVGGEEQNLEADKNSKKFETADSRPREQQQQQQQQKKLRQESGQRWARGRRQWAACGRE